MSSKNTEPRCPSGYHYSRDGGSRCYGGTHVAGESDATQSAANYQDFSQGQGQGGDNQANSQKGQGSCRHGFQYNRENGTRCAGGTHRAGEGADDLQGGQGGAGGQGYGAQGQGSCRHGFPYNRDAGTRCKGGSHHAGAGEDGQGNKAGDDLGYNQPTGNCRHKFPFNRDGGSRCKGGSHYVNPNDTASNQSVRSGQNGQDGQNGQSAADSQALQRRRRYGDCEHGYKFNREGGNRCQGGTHYVDGGNNGKDYLTAFQAYQNRHKKGNCRHGYPYTREDGNRCTGGTHYANE